MKITASVSVSKSENSYKIFKVPLHFKHIKNKMGVSAIVQVHKVTLIAQESRI